MNFEEQCKNGDIETTNKYLHCVEEADKESADIQKQGRKEYTFLL